MDTPGLNGWRYVTGISSMMWRFSTKSAWVLLGIVALASWLPSARTSVVTHPQDSSPNTSALWDYIHHYEAQDLTDIRPTLEHDMAWLTLNISARFNVQVWAQTHDCWKCPLVYEEEVPSLSTTTILVNTTFATDIKLSRQHPGGFTEDICRLTVSFREHGNYWVFVDHTTALQPSPCLLLLANDPAHPDMPILFVGLGLLGLAAFVAMSSKLYSCLQTTVRSRKNANITDPSHSPDSSNTDINLDKDVPVDVETVMNGAGNPEPPAEKKQPRLKSLDTIRGLNMAMMIFVNYGGGGYWIFEHATWNGLTVADLVFPWFIFVMGTSMTFSFKGMYRRQMTSLAIVIKIVIRSAKLFVLGIVLNTSWGPVELSELRIPGVLQRFALTYLVTALIKLLFYTQKDTYQKRRWAVVRDVVLSLPEWCIHLALLALYLGLTYALPVPGCPTGYTGPGGISEGGAYFNCTGGAARYIDVLVLGEGHIYQHPTPQEVYDSVVAYDPEGILGTLTSIFLCFLGIQSGNILSFFRGHRSRIIRWLIWAVITGVPAAILCKCSENDGWIPVNKNLWSLSFVLTNASLAFVLLTLLYLVIDVLGWWDGQPFIYPGMNSIVVYFCHAIFWRVLPITWEVDPLHWTLLLQDVWGTAFWVIVAYILFRKKIFIAL